MNEKNWQVSYVIKGLIVPKEGITYGNDIIVKRCGEDVEKAQFIMRVAEEDVRKGESAITPKFENDVANMLLLYAVEKGNFVALPRGYSASLIKDDRPFGKISPEKITIKVRADESHLTRIISESSSALKYALRAYESLKCVFEDDSKAFLRHGLKYYYMALGEHDIQRKVIDLFIALEALFSAGEEIRFRTSLRIASLLGFLGLDKKEVFDTMYELYNKRSKIVHGVESVDVSLDEVFKLERYLRDCFRVFLYLDKGKDDFINMLDICLIDEEVSLRLKEAIVNAYKRWEKERIGSK